MCPDPRARAGTAPFRIDKAPGNWLLTHSAAPPGECNALRRVPPPASFDASGRRSAERRACPGRSTVWYRGPFFTEAPMPRYAIDEWSRWQFGAWAASAALGYAVAVLSPALAEPNNPIPNFAPDSTTGWLKPPGDEFIAPASGPGPVRFDPARPYVSNAVAAQETVKIADVTNPILQPWVAEQMKKPMTRCWRGRSDSRRERVAGRMVFPVSCSIRSIPYSSFRRRSRS